MYLYTLYLLLLIKLTYFLLLSGAYDEAKEVGRHAVLKYRAELIADYETIEKPLGNKKGNPRYIYFVGKSDYIEKWLRKSEKARENHKNFLAEIDDIAIHGIMMVIMTMKIVTTMKEVTFILL